MTLFDRLNPFQSTILSKHCLNGTPGNRETWHFALSIAGSGIQYKPGDSVAVYPTNDPIQVSAILKATGLPEDALVKDTKGIEYSLREYLERKANIGHVPKKFLVELASRGTSTKLEQLLQDDVALKQYTSTHNLAEIVEENTHIVFEAQPFVQALQPMLPRFYSIASSQSETPDEVHLTVARVHYAIEGRERRGICSHFLCDLAPLQKACVPLYLQSSKDFSVPVDDERKMIMIGPGTGVAPFRGFMQERMCRKAAGANWLFFGERYKHNDFFYGDYWNELVQQGHLRLDTAFSRDQDEKIYVQTLMQQRKADIWQWLQEGAVIYVCGSADTMAKDVDRSLHEIISQEGHLTPEGAKEYVKHLRHEKRYLRDVY